MTDAVRLFNHTFDGAGYPNFAVVWPDFEWPAGNNTTWSKPVVDGHGHGMGSRSVSGLTWRAKSVRTPGRSDYQADLWCRWKNAPYGAQREVGLIVRFVDFNNLLVARVKPIGGGSGELRLFKRIAGVESQLGSTYTGSGVDGTAMGNGLRWRVRVEDLLDGSGNTRVTVYTEPQGGTAKGTQRIDVTADLSQLRGAYTVGVELGTVVFADDVFVDDLEVYDLSDEWTAPAVGDGTGWKVELGSTLYSLADLNALSPPLKLKTVHQAYGPGGNRAVFEVLGDFRLGATIFPRRQCRVFHDGKVRFRGWVGKGQLDAAPEERQSWEARDAYWESRLVGLREDDKSGQLTFNVFDTESDDYRGDRQALTVGQIVKFLFDRYTTGPENLQFYGCAPAVGNAYVQTELDAMDAVIPDVALAGSFPAAIETLLRYMPKFQVFVDPETLIWHFTDVTNFTAEAIALTAEWATLSIAPDPDASETAVEWFGAKKEAANPVTLKLSDGSLTPLWSKTQEDNFSKKKKSAKRLTGKIVTAGTGTFEGVTGPWFDVPAGLNVKEDDWKGGVAFVDGDGFLRIVKKNTSTRFWLTAPAWGGGTPPSANSIFSVNLMHPDAIAELSANGVGRGFKLERPFEICGYPSASYALGMKHHGWCGSAIVELHGDDGVVHSEEYQYEVRARNAFQVAAGYCDPTIVLARPVLPPVGLVNFLPPPGGSPPSGVCQPGNDNKPMQMPLVDVQITLSELEDDAASFREPTAGYTGRAFSENPANWAGGGQPSGTDWGVKKVLRVEDPDFVDDSQVAGLRKAAQAYLAIRAQKAFLWQVRLASPWKAYPGLFQQAGQTSRFAGLTKRITISSAKRTTGFETTTDLSVFHVTWDVENSATELEAGTAAGWLSPEAQNIAKAFSDKRFLKKAAKMIQGLEDFRNRLLSKHADRLGGQSNAAIPGCDVTVVQRDQFEIRDVEDDDRKKWQGINHLSLARVADMSMLFGEEDTYPGAPIAVPGRDGAEAKQVQPDGGPVLAPHARHDVLGQGPTSDPNGTAGRYGGLITTDRALAGMAPDTIERRGGVAIRKKANAGGLRGAGTGLEWSNLDGHGNPTGGWFPYAGPRSLPGSRVKYNALKAGAIAHQLLKRTDELADLLGVVRGDVDELLQAGATSAAYASGAPPSHFTSLLVAATASSHLRPLLHTKNDPGGLVFTGPVTESGVDAGLYWRVMVPEQLLVRVNAVSYGTGLNGGGWSWNTAGPGSSMEYLTQGTVFHKQIHGNVLKDDPRQPNATTVFADDSPIGFAGQDGRFMPVAGNSAAGGRMSMPAFARGTMMVTAHLHEDGGETPPAGTFINGVFQWATRGSPWGAVLQASTDGEVKTDGAGTGSGILRGPLGAVPPGLRKPFDLVVVFKRTPGANGDNYAHDAVITGLDVEVAVVEGGYLVRVTESSTLTESVTHNAPWAHEILIPSDAAVLEIGKGLAESLVMQDSVAVELNPPILVFEELTVSDNVVPLLNP